MIYIFDWSSHIDITLNMIKNLLNITFGLIQWVFLPTPQKLYKLKLRFDIFYDNLGLVGKKYLFLSINVNYDYYLRALKKTEKKQEFLKFLINWYFWISGVLFSWYEANYLIWTIKIVQIRSIYFAVEVNHYYYYFTWSSW